MNWNWAQAASLRQRGVAQAASLRQRGDEKKKCKNIWLIEKMLLLLSLEINCFIYD
ncbi:hypothetical protein HMPREF9075_00880 [Capnocytophaga sp. oral taxon 332 str. F0381]|nr:hypothetical protein HMPREF9075_00880 [Capnocytophaga sp. oral taxon 332 str. F0381]